MASGTIDALDGGARRVGIPQTTGPAELRATASTAQRGLVFARPVDDLWSSSASRDWCGASPRHRVIQPFAAEGARLDELDAGGAATASRRRFLPQLSGGPISAPGVVDAHLCARRGAMTSRSLTATCPSAPRIGMLCVAALHGADDSRTAARKRQMRAPRGCFRPACLGLLHLAPDFFDGFLAFPNASSENGFIRPKTFPLQH